MFARELLALHPKLKLDIKLAENVQDLLAEGIDLAIRVLTGGMATRPKPGFRLVTSTFAAVEALSGSLALELAPTRVNTIRPGFIDTDMWSFLPAEHRDGLRKKVEETFPARRSGTSQDIGHAALFLMTNPYVTGTVMEVSGGENLVPSVS